MAVRAPGLEPVQLPHPCAGCNERSGYYDQRTGKHVCARCGRNVIQKSEAKP